MEPVASSSHLRPRKTATVHKPSSAKRVGSALDTHRRVALTRSASTSSARRAPRRVRLASRPKSATSSPLLITRSKRRSLCDDSTSDATLVDPPKRYRSTRRRLFSTSSSPPRGSFAPQVFDADANASSFTFPIFHSNASLDSLLDPPPEASDLDHDAAPTPGRSFTLDGRTRSPLTTCIRELLGNVERELESGPSKDAECRAVQVFTPVVESVGTGYAVRVERWASPLPTRVGVPLADPSSRASPPIRSPTSPAPSSRLRFATSAHQKSASEAAAPTSPRRPGLLLRKLSTDGLFGRPRVAQRSNSVPVVKHERPVSMLDALSLSTAPTGEKKRSFLSRTLSTRDRSKDGRRTIFGIRVR